MTGPGAANTVHPIPSPPPGTVTISNGANTVQIRDGTGGVTVSSSRPGTITVTNGSESQTLSGGSLTISGAKGIGGDKSVQVGAVNGEGRAAVAIAPPPPPPPGKPCCSDQFDSGFASGVDNVIKGISDFGHGVAHGFQGGPAPPPTTSTTTQY